MTREEKLIRDRIYRKNYRERKRAEIYAAQKSQRAHPDNAYKLAAQRKWNRAVRNGFVSPRAGYHFHHVDYDYPYVGAWLTHLEHRLVHSGKREVSLCEIEDYTDIVSHKHAEHMGRLREIQKENGRRMCRERWNS